MVEYEDEIIDRCPFNKRVHGAGRKPSLGALEDLLIDEIFELITNKFKVTMREFNADQQKQTLKIALN